MIAVSADLNVPASVVWGLMSDVEGWPRWMPTVSSVKPVGDQRANVGARYQVRQPRLPKATWVVTEWAEDHGFTWESHGIGLVTLAGHTVEATGTGTAVQLSIEWSGPLATLARKLYGKVAEKYITSELTALQSEVRAASAL